MNTDLIIAGAGLFGLTIAERAASHGYRVLLLDQRQHIGGNAYSYTDPGTGIEVHQYGAHIFHTSNDQVWAYVNRFTSFTRYEHRVLTMYRGQVYPLPISLATMCQFYGCALSPGQARALIEAETRQAGPADSLEGKAIATVGRSLYEAFIRGYTMKQWQADPATLPASVISRLPVRYTFDTRYFSDTHQGLPTQGYGSWLEAMADHPCIEIQLGTGYVPGTAGDVPVIYTGPLDAYFDHWHGRLGWRTLRFDFQNVDVGDFQGTAVMNYADPEIPHTRVIEFRHFHPERLAPVDKTVVAREYSQTAGPGDEPYYPVNAAGDRDRVSAYRQLARAEPGVWFGGRLGTYAYLDMHQAIASALALWQKRLQPRLAGQVPVRGRA